MKDKGRCLLLAVYFFSGMLYMWIMRTFVMYTLVRYIAIITIPPKKKRYKDVLKSTLKAYNIPVDEWQALAQDRPAWRAAIRKGTKQFERSRLQSLDDKRSARKNRVPNPTTAVPCQLCGKICASTFGLQAHMRKHQH